MGDNSYFGLFLIFILLLPLIAAIKVRLAKAAPRHRPTTRSPAAVDDLSGDNWEPSQDHSGHHDGGGSAHSDSSDNDSYSDSSSDSGSGRGDSSSD